MAEEQEYLRNSFPYLWIACNAISVLYICINNAQSFINKRLCFPLILSHQTTCSPLTKKRLTSAGSKGHIILGSDWLLFFYIVNLCIKICMIERVQQDY